MKIVYELQVLRASCLNELVHPTCNFLALPVKESNILTDFGFLFLHEHGPSLVELMETLADTEVYVPTVDEAAPLAYHFTLLPSALTAAALLHLPAPREVPILYLLPLRSMYLQSGQALSKDAADFFGI